MKSLVLLIVLLLAACGGERSNEPAPAAASPSAPAATTGGDAAKGKQLIETYACTACHQIPGFERGGAMGPSLAGIASRETMTTGVRIDAPTMVAYLQNPPAVDPQTRMPPLGISEEESRHMTAFLFTLK